MRKTCADPFPGWALGFHRPAGGGGLSAESASGTRATACRWLSLPALLTEEGWVCPRGSFLEPQTISQLSERRHGTPV